MDVFVVAGAYALGLVSGILATLILAAVVAGARVDRLDQ